MKLLSRRFAWRPNPVGRAERLRAAAGAFCGLLLTALVTRLAGPGHGAAYLIAPMGASSVLLFCVPASPLAQPWSVIGGNTIAGLTGMTCVLLLGQLLPLAALAALAGCLAIALMSTLRCLHPPSGAVALTVVLGGPAVHAAGYSFVLAPVALNSVLLVAAAVVYNNLTGRRYPHRQQAAHPNPHASRDALPADRLGFKPEDLDAVLRRYNQVLDISRDDLEAIFKQTEMQAYARRFGIITCADIMSKDVLTAEFGTELPLAWRQMQEHRFSAMPVLNRTRRVIGIVTQNDFLKHSGLDDYAAIGRRLRHFLRPSGNSHSEKAEVVGQIMTAHPSTARAGAPITELVPLMADAEQHHVLVVDEDGRFAGIVTQSGLVAALYESRFTETQETQETASAAV
ncbi:MAG TPA: HPP family protein [Janthinobacterium sp.]|nr:HPP family protein [Janthinobacterium sp.]